MIHSKYSLMWSAVCPHKLVEPQHSNGQHGAIIYIMAGDSNMLPC